MTSKAAQHEGAAASKIRLRIEASLNRKVSTNALLLSCAQGEYATSFNLNRIPSRYRRSIELCAHVGTCQGDACIHMKLEAATHRGELNGSSILRIANQSIRNAEGQMIHWPGRWHANVPIPDTAWIVLNRALRPFAGSRLKVLRGVLSIYPSFDGCPNTLDRERLQRL